MTLLPPNPESAEFWEGKLAKEGMPDALSPIPTESDESEGMKKIRNLMRSYYVERGGTVHGEHKQYLQELAVRIRSEKIIDLGEHELDEGMIEEVAEEINAAKEFIEKDKREITKKSKVLAFNPKALKKRILGDMTKEFPDFETEVIEQIIDRSIEEEA